MSEESEKVSRRRRILAVGGVVLAIVLAVGLTFYLPPDVRTLLVGKTVEHCPNSEFSCPSQQPGLLLLFLPLVMLVEHLYGDEHNA